MCCYIYITVTATKISCNSTKNQKAREVPSGLAMKLAEQAESEEERKFYAFIMTMNLQRKQKEAIEKNLF